MEISFCRTATRRQAISISRRSRALARSHLRRKRVVVHAHAVILHKTYALRPGAQNKLVAAIRHVRSRRPTSLPFSLISIGTVCLAGERTRLLRASHVLRTDLFSLRRDDSNRTRKIAFRIAYRFDYPPRNGRYHDKLFQLTELDSLPLKIQIQIIEGVHVIISVRLNTYSYISYIEVIFFPCRTDPIFLYEYVSKLSVESLARKTAGKMVTRRCTSIPHMTNAEC